MFVNTFEYSRRVQRIDNILYSTDHQSLDLIISLQNNVLIVMSLFLMLIQMETTIRFAETKDLESLLKIDRLAHQEFPDWWDCLEASEMKKLIGKSKFNVLVAVVDGGIVGFLRGSLSEKNMLYVDDIFVLKELRGQGLGKQMMNLFLEEWKGKAVSVGLHTEDFNVKKFEKMGFKKKMNFMYRKL